MPGMNGIRLAQAMLGQHPDLPIIVCTDYSDNVNETIAEATGIRSFMKKPLDMQMLFKKLEELLK